MTKPSVLSYYRSGEARACNYAALAATAGRCTTTTTTTTGTCISVRAV